MAGSHPELGIYHLNRGTLISGTGHLVLISGLIAGDWLEDRMEFNTPPDVADVVIFSEREYAELALPQLELPLPDIPDSLEPRSADIPAIAPGATDSMAVVETPEPVIQDEKDVLPETPVVPDVPEPLPLEPTERLPTEIALREPTPPLPPDSQPSEDDPTPHEAPRIAPDPVLESPPSPEFSEIPVPPVSPEAEGPDVAPDLPEAAPEKATTEIVTEAETPSFAPEVSAIPVARPTRPASPEPERSDAEAEQTADAVSEAEPDQPPDQPVADFTEMIKNAVDAAAANSDPDSEPSPIATPALSPDEIQGLRNAVRQCWNVGALSTEALMVTVTVGISMRPDGTPERPRLLGYSGGSEAAAHKAFDVARRAILRCGSDGYNLPADRYERWRDIEITFNPEKMRLK